jgi:hypothetical protein
LAPALMASPQRAARQNVGKARERIKLTAKTRRREGRREDERGGETVNPSTTPLLPLSSSRLPAFAVHLLTRFYQRRGEEGRESFRLKD